MLTSCESQLKFQCDFESKSQRAELQEAIRTAIRTHNNNTKDALQGLGFDRHFFAMKKMAEMHNLPLVLKF